MNRFLSAAVVFTIVSACGCKTPPEPEPVVTKEMQDSLIAGFKDIVKVQDSCSDMKAYVEYHTLQARAALKALDDVVDPAFLDPAKAGVTQDKGALWTCLLAARAGFTTDRTTVKRLAIDPRSKLARVIFSIDGYEFGFPMARQDGRWRSPFPGQVFLAGQYAFWSDGIRKSIPPENADKLESRINLAVHKLKGYQPNWALYPEVGDVETDDVQVQIKKQVEETVKAAQESAN